jgi:hypothetical protein
MAAFWSKLSMSQNLRLFQEAHKGKKESTIKMKQPFFSVKPPTGRII